MKRVMVILGTRPEGIKMAPVIKELKKYPEFFEVKVCSTGQHREMLGQVLDFFGIVCDYTLDVMTPNQTLADVTRNFFSSGGRMSFLCREIRLRFCLPRWLRFITRSKSDM